MGILEMNATASKQRDYSDSNNPEDILKNILKTQGYYHINIFNNNGKRISKENGLDCGVQSCEYMKNNGGSCNYHLVAAQKILDGKTDSRVFCARDNEAILLSVPLKTSKGKNIGVVIGCKRAMVSDVCRDRNELEFLKAVSTLAADKIYQDMEIKSLTEELNIKYEEIALLYEIGENIQINDKIDNSIEYIVNRAMEVVNPSLVVWSSLNGEKNRFYENHERKSENENINKEKIEGIFCQVMKIVSRSKSPLILNNLNKYREFAGVVREPVNLLSIPLVSDNKVFGALNFIEFDPERIFVNDHLKLMESISRNTVTLLKNAELYGKLKNLFFNVLRMLLGIIESKDSYTEGHSKRVCRISVEFAKMLRLSKKDIFDLKWAAILHDIGKITIPSYILKKPDKLTEEEFGLIKLHPGKGVELVSNIEEFKDSVKGIRYHHERMDGMGYPDGLAGEKIPLIARIICIADTFDALNSARPYRAKPSQEFVIEELKRSTPAQFDPFLIELFLKNYDKFLKLLEVEEYDIVNDIDFKGIW